MALQSLPHNERQRGGMLTRAGMNAGFNQGEACLMAFMGAGGIAYTLQVWRGHCGKYLLRLTANRQPSREIENVVFDSPYELARWLRRENRKRHFHTGCNIELTAMCLLLEHGEISK